MYRGQEDSTTGETTGRTAGVPSHPQAPTVPRRPALWGPTRGSRQTHMSFSLRSPMMPQCDPLRGAQSRWLWGYAGGTPHVGMRLLGRVSLNSVRGHHHSTCQSVLRLDSVILAGASQSHLGQACSLGDRCRQKGHDLFYVGHQSSLLTALHQSSVRVFLPWVVWANKMRQAWFRSKRKLYSLIKEWKGGSSCSKAEVPNLFGTRDWLHGRQFFHGLYWVGGMVVGWFEHITFIEFVEQEAELRQ